MKGRALIHITPYLLDDLCPGASAALRHAPMSREAGGDRLFGAIDRLLGNPATVRAPSAERPISEYTLRTGPSAELRGLRAWWEPTVLAITVEVEGEGLPFPEGQPAAPIIVNYTRYYWRLGEPEPSGKLKELNIEVQS